MRVLHLIQRYYPARGGAEKYLEEISNHLAREGHHVTVVTSDALDFELFWDPDKKRLADAVDSYKGVEILRFPVRHLPVSQLAFPGLRRILFMLSKISFIPVRTLQIIANYTPWLPTMLQWTKECESKYDLVAASSVGFEPILLAGLTYARRTSIPFVTIPLTHLGAGPAPGMDAVSRFYTMRHQSALVLESDMVIAMTPSESQYYVNMGLEADKVRVASPGVDPDEVLGGVGDRFRKKHGVVNPMVLYLGYLSRDKGAFSTVEAMMHLWRSGREVDLTLIGAISVEFQRFFDDLPEKFKGRIHLLGQVDDAEKRDALAASSLLSMPSRTDSFGITYLEAWLYGIPVIAARTWGVTDVVEDTVDGIIVPYGDAEAISSAVQFILENQSSAMEMGERGREKVYRKHLTNQSVCSVEAIYRGLTKQ